MHRTGPNVIFTLQVNGTKIKEKGENISFLHAVFIYLFFLNQALIMQNKTFLVSEFKEEYKGEFLHFFY